MEHVFSQVLCIFSYRYCVCVLRSPPDYSNATTLMNLIVTNSRHGRERSLLLTESTAIANISGFIGASLNGLSTLDPALTLSLQRMNEFLLNNKVRARMPSHSTRVPSHTILLLQSMFMESLYGAYVFDGTWQAPQAADVIAYTALQNSTAAHAPAIFMNVSRSLYVCSLHRCDSFLLL
jgi:hypothetical protein